MTSSSHPLVSAVQPVIEAVGASIVGATELEGSDVPLVWNGEVVAAVRLPPLHGALDRLVAAVESELGRPLPELGREDKQRAVRMLDERGAFIRDIGEWDPLPAHLAVPFRLAGREAQVAFWGGGAPQDSMLHQLANAA